MDSIGKKFLGVLNDFGMKLTHDLKESLHKNGVVGGGETASKLAGSINFKLIKGEMAIGVTMADYWEYVEHGTRPSKYGATNKHSLKKINNIIAWLKWKGITPTLKQKVEDTHKGLKNKTVKKSFKQASYDSAYKSLAFAVATNISKRGTSNRNRADTFNGPVGTHFVKEVLEDGRVDELIETIVKEFGLEIKVNIVEEFQKSL